MSAASPKITEPLYAGIENEFELVNEVQTTDDKMFLTWLSTHKNPSVFRSRQSIRTGQGGAIYWDSGNPEVCTPPSRIQKGFATELAHNLYVMRKELVEMVYAQDHKLAGYTTHYNFSAMLTGDQRINLMDLLYPAYQMFMLTPTSCGINIRPKGDDQHGNHTREEVLGDYIENLDQIRATLLFVAGSLIAQSSVANRLPFIMLDNRVKRSSRSREYRTFYSIVQHNERKPICH
jgi:hypothetical protein